MKAFTSTIGAILSLFLFSTTTTTFAAPVAAPGLLYDTSVRPTHFRVTVLSRRDLHDEPLPVLFDQRDRDDFMVAEADDDDEDELLDCDIVSDPNSPVLVDRSDEEDEEDGVEDVLDIVDGIEEKIKPILSELSSSSITYIRVKTLLPEISSLLHTLQTELTHLKPIHPSSPAECHLIALRITSLIGDILKSLNNAVITLRIDIAVLKPLISSISDAIQDVLNASIGAVDGLDAQLLAPLKTSEGILVKLGINLVVNGIRV